MKELNVKVGDRIVYSGPGFQTKEIKIITTVIEVTSTKRIRVEYNPSVQFDKYGKAFGDNIYFSPRLLELESELDREFTTNRIRRKWFNKIKSLKFEDLSYEQAKKMLDIMDN